MNNNIPIDDSKKDGGKNEPTDGHGDDISIEKIPEDLNRSRSPINGDQTQIQKQLESELGLARFLDYIVNEPFELIFQDQIIGRYEHQLVDVLFGDNINEDNLDGRYISLREDFRDLGIKERYRKILKTAEDVAREHNISKPYLVKAKNISLWIMSSVFIAFFILMAVDRTGTVSSLYLPLAIVMCFFPKYVQKVVLRKWEALKKELMKDLLERVRDDMDNLKTFIQYLLDDVRERLLEYHIPLQIINFMVLSPDYDHVKIVTTQETRGIKHYVLQFEYPKGMQPFEVPKSLQRNISPDFRNSEGTYGGSGGSSAKEDLDEFIMLKNPLYNEQGQIEDFEIYRPVKIDIEGIETILNRSEFSSVPKPEAVVPFFNNNERIKCECGKPIKMRSLKTCTTTINETPFEFYMIIGEKCSCGREPFILFTSPGNESTPSEVLDLFGDVREKEE